MLRNLTLFFAIATSVISQAQADWKHVPSGVHLEAGNNHLNNEEYNAAINFYDKINRSDTLYDAAQFNTVLCLFNKEDYSGLIKVVKKAIQDENGFETDLYKYYVEALIAQKKYTEARVIAKEALKKYPLVFHYEYLIGKSYIEEGEVLKGEKLIQDVIAGHYQHAPSHYTLGKSKADRGHFAESLFAFQFAIIANRSSDFLGKSYMGMVNTLTDNYEVKKSEEINSNYKNLNQLVKSQIASKETYKADIKMPHLINNIIDIMFKQFEYKEGQNLFTMDYYGKFFHEVKTRRLQKGYILYLLSIDMSPATQQMVNIHRDEVEAFEKLLTEYFEKPQSKITYPINGKTYEGTYNYTSSGRLFGIGEIKDDNAIGSWIYFYPTGVVKSEVSYNNEGELNGKSTWYDAFGNIIQYGTYKDGKLNGEGYFSHDDNDCKWYSATFIDNEWEGKAEICNGAGIPIERKSFVEGKLVGEYTEIGLSGSVTSKVNYVNDKMEGPIDAFYDNGKVYGEAVMKNGLFNGKQLKLHENGKTMILGQFKDGKSVGKWQEFYYDGSIAAQYSYNSAGELDGDYIEFELNGDTATKTPYKNGSLTGMKIDYAANNKPLWKRLYKNGKLKKYFNLDSNGVIINKGKKNYLLHDIYGYKYIEGTVKGSGFHGEYKTYWKNGAIHTKRNYKKGVAIGKHEEFYESGEVDFIEYFKDDLRHGRYESYYINGNKYAEGYFDNGDKVGEWKYYHPNGKVRLTEYYSNGSLRGIVCEYSIEGVLQYETLYKGGVIVRADVFNEDGKLLKRYQLPQGNGDYSLVHPSGYNRMKGNFAHGEQNGEFKFMYPNGKVYEIRNRINGVYHGKLKLYYPDGKLMREGNYEHGKKVGPWKSYHFNGELSFEANYEYDVVRDSSVWYDSKGQKYKCFHYDVLGNETKQVYYHPNGALSSISYMDNDFVHGILNTYDDQGELLISRKYNGGQIVAYSFMKDGKLQPYKPFNGTGVIKATFNNGKPSAEFHLKKGYYEGKYIRYYSNGQIWIDSKNKSDKSTGMYKVYYSNGNLKFEGEYDFDRLNGICNSYWENGKVKEKENYVQGALHGECKYYSEAGKLLYTIVYNDDVPVSIK